MDYEDSNPFNGLPTSKARILDSRDDESRLPGLRLLETIALAARKKDFTSLPILLLKFAHWYRYRMPWDIRMIYRLREPAA